MDVINDVAVSKDGKCSDGYLPFFQEVWEGKSLNTWILPNNERVVLCIKRVKDYNFATKYLLTPKCKREDEEICGGVDLETKFCIPKDVNCPYSAFKILESKDTKQEQFEIIQNFENNYRLFGSKLANSPPIVEFRVSYGNGVCMNPKSFVSYYDSLLYDDALYPCQGIDEAYNLIGSIDAKIFFIANNFYTEGNLPAEMNQTNRVVGLYTKGYVQWSIDCRDTLVERVNESDQYWEDMIKVSLATTIISFLYFGIVGVIVNTTQVMTQEECPLPCVEHHKELKYIRVCLMVIRIIFFIPLFVIIIFNYFLEAQMHNTLKRSINQRCSNDNTLLIFQDMFDKINKFRTYIIPIFWIFIIVLIVETGVCIIVIYRSLSNQRRILIENSYDQIQIPQYLELQEEELAKNLGYSAVYTLPTQTREEKNVTPQYFQRPSFNPVDQMELRKSIQRLSIQGGNQTKKSQPVQPSKVNMIQAISESGESSERSSVIAHKNVEQQPMQQFQMPLNNFQTPTNQGQEQIFKRQFDTFQSREVQKQSAQKQGQNLSPQFQGKSYFMQNGSE